MKTRHISLLILSTFVLTGCPLQIGELKPEDPAAFGQPDRKADVFHGLIIQVSDDESELFVRAPVNMSCTKEDRKLPGCLNVRRRYRANIPFKLHNDDAAVWHFNSFIICSGKTKQDPPCPLIRAEMRDFDARLSDDSKTLVHLDENGTIDLTQLAANPTEFVLHDQNSLRQDYYYRITVCKNALPAVCLTLDPGVRNGGGR